MLFVPNLALKLVFLPVREAAALLDRYAVVENVIDILYNDDRTASILPSLSLQSGYGLSYGLSASHTNLFGHAEEGALKAKFGGIYLQGYEASLKGDHIGGSHVWTNAVLRYEYKPALWFQGIGDPAADSAGAGLADPRVTAIATRYRQQRFLASVGAGYSVGDVPITKVGPVAIFNHRTFGPEAHEFAEPSIEEAYDTALIQGFDDTLNLVELDLSFVHDSRPKRALPATGTYVEAFAGGLLPTERYAFWHTGLEVAQYFDLYRGNRVLVLRAAIDAVTGPRSKIPFTELPRLGGSSTLRGYLYDRFRDRVAVVATAEYRYPVHQLVSGALFVDAGQIAGDMAGLGPLSQWKVSPGFGLLLHAPESDRHTPDDKGAVDDTRPSLLGVEVAYGEGLTIIFSTDPLRAFSKREKEL